MNGFWARETENNISPPTGDIPKITDNQIAHVARALLGGGASEGLPSVGDWYGLSSKTLSRTTEGFYDTALNEANDA
ncbi:hypothetical protein FHS27_006494 [Rhodopirellula rubra]|uniref:Uncharacterized protein n=1 Tax=Aporhodopirellula rubra TaxID=980271 RepID=A0A7W5E5L4_9BACT|nr:hypothetical protein [Aporhodopirellula rubra]